MRYILLLLIILTSGFINAQHIQAPIEPKVHVYKIGNSDSLKAYVFFPRDRHICEKYPSISIFPSSSPDSIISSIPNALILQSPALSVINDGWFEQLLLQRGKPIEYSPAEHITGKLPPSIIVIGRDDTVTPLKYSEFYQSEMLNQGNICELHVYNGVGHLFTPSDQPDDGWPQPDKEVSKKAFSDIDRFLKGLGYLK